MQTHQKELWGFLWLIEETSVLYSVVWDIMACSDGQCCLPASEEPSDQLALMYAIADDNIEKVGQLLAAGVDVNAVCHGRHAMCVAAQEGRTAMIDLLVAAGGDISISDPSDSMWQRQPIHLAAAKGHVEVVERLVAAGIRINTGDAEGRTPLHWAATSGWVRMSEYLVRHGATVNFAQKDGFTPLHAATYLGHITTCKYLLEHGADVNRADRDGWACLHAATCYGHPDLIRLFINAGAAVNQKTRDQESPLHIAVDSGNIASIEILLDAGADIEARNINGFTPLFEAVWRNKYEAAKYLIDQGARVDVQNYAGHSPLYIATVRVQKAYLDLLLAAGCTEQNEAWLWQSRLPVFLDDHRPLCNWLMKCLPRPTPLQDMCCRVIRASLRRNIATRARQLPLPARLQNALALSHITWVGV